MQDGTTAEGQVLVIEESQHGVIKEKLQPSRLRQDQRLVNIMVVNCPALTLGFGYDLEAYEQSITCPRPAFGI